MEMVAVVAIVAVVASVSVPSVVRFVETGNQVNRMNIARTLYLAAQNQLTELRITRNLESAVDAAEIYYRDVDEDGVETLNLSSDSNVFTALGYMPEGYNDWTDEEDNRYYVHFISKPAGYAYGSGDKAADFALDLLSPTITATEVLDYAILIEFNIKTGIVLSLFYSDILPTDTSVNVDDRSFRYSGEYSDARNVLGPRSMGPNGYDRNEAPSRRQGFFGIMNTGVLPIVIEPMSVTIYDSLDDKEALEELGVDIGNQNTLLAMITITPEALVSDNELQISLQSNGRQVLSERFRPYQLPSHLSTTLLDSSEARDNIYRVPLEDPNYPDDAPAGYGIIWVLDQVIGDTNSLRRGIGRFAEDLNPMELITVSIQDTQTGASTQSFGKHPYTGAGTSGNSFVINSARHLNNIRYVNDTAKFEPNRLAGFKFMQRQGVINLGSIDHFEPLPDFSGEYIGYHNTISNLNSNPSNGHAGLFRRIVPGGIVRDMVFANPVIRSSSEYAAGVVAGVNSSGENGEGLISNVSIINPAVSGRDAGAVTGRNNGTIDTAFVKYDLGSGGLTAENCASRRIVNRSVASENGTFEGSAGGIAGINSGIIKDVTFLSPHASVHISGANAGGIAGGANTGKIDNALFLALAPMERSNADPSLNMIVPITRPTLDDMVSNAYYLCGLEPLRPSSEEIEAAVLAESQNIPTVRNGYNIEEAYLEIGTPLSTWELYDLLNADDPAAFTLEAWIKWRQPVLTEELALSLENEIYPYPYIPRWLGNDTAARTVPGNFDWPIVDAGQLIPDAIVTYFEIYSDGEWGYAHEDIEQPLKNGADAVVTHDGYAVRMNYITGEYVLGVNGISDSTYTLIFAEEDGVKRVRIQGHQWPTRVDEPVTVDGSLVTYAWVFIPNAVLEDAVTQDSVRLVTETPSEDRHLVTLLLNDEEIDDEFNPFFPPGILQIEEGDNLSVIRFIFIRSPRHLDNIDADLYEIQGSRRVRNDVYVSVIITDGTYLNKNFTQQLNLDFALYRKALGWQNGALAPSGNPLGFETSVVKHEYKGTYYSLDIDGEKPEIRNLTITAIDDNNYNSDDRNYDSDEVITGVGLFERIGEGGIVWNLRFDNCRIATLANTGEGESVSGSSASGVLVGINNGIVNEIIVDESSVMIFGANTTLIAGGVAGINNGTVSAVEVINSSIEAESGIGIGGITGINNQYIVQARLEKSRVAVLGSPSLGGMENSSRTVGVGGIAGINNSIIAGANVIDNDEITTPNGTAGGIAGTNNSRSRISDSAVRRNFISITNYGTAGGVTGINISGFIIDIDIDDDIDEETLANLGNVDISRGIIEDVFLDDNFIHAEAGSAGGVVATNGGDIRNVVFVSSEIDSPITGQNLGGIVRNNTGTIVDVMFIAVAPNQAPITASAVGDGSVTNAYYLSSHPSAPGREPFPAPEMYNLDEYNPFGASSGLPQTSYELNSMFYNLRFWDRWDMVFFTSEAAILANGTRLIGNAAFPYPILERLKDDPPEEWPIAAVIISGDDDNDQGEDDDD